MTKSLGRVVHYSVTNRLCVCMNVVLTMCPYKRGSVKPQLGKLSQYICRYV